MTQENPASQITCPHCGQAYAVRPEQWPQYQGRTIACAKCGQSFTVGGQSAHLPPAFPPAAPAGYPTAGATPGDYGPQGLAAAQPGYPQQGYYPPRKSSSGWLIALGIGGGAVILMALLCAGLLFPSLNRAREHANRVKCASNLRQIGLACIMYANGQKNGAFPDSLQTLMKDPNADITGEVFICPSTTDTAPAGSTGSQIAGNLTQGHLSYIYVGKGLTNNSGANVVLAYEPLTNHRNEGMNVLYADGHVDWATATAAANIVKQVQAGNQLGAMPDAPGASTAPSDQ